MPPHTAHPQESHAGHQSGTRQGNAAYLRLAIAMGISFVVMFAIMFARVNAADNIRLSLNNVYMAGLMVAPMPLIMLATMPMMFRNRALNGLVAASAAGLAALFFVLIRTQAGIDDRQFLRSMIPHHAGAILVCERAALADNEVRRLCGQIIESQQREIAQMKDMLAR